MGRDPREAGREGTEGGRSGRRVPGSGPASAKVLRQKCAQCVCRTGRRPVGLGQSECQGSWGGFGGLMGHWEELAFPLSVSQNSQVFTRSLWLLG